MSIYKKMADAIKDYPSPIEVIVIGSNDNAGSVRWSFPVSTDCITRYDALAAEGSDVVRAVVHNHPGVMVLHHIDTTQNTPDSNWIYGVSSLRPERNAQNLRSGSIEDQNFLKENLRREFVKITTIDEIASSEKNKFFVLDLEGIDFDITLRLLMRDDVVGIGFEHVLMTDDEIITLRCEAASRGFCFDSSQEDTIFLRD